MRLNTKYTIWTIWLGITISFASYYAYAITSPNKSVFLPGKTTSGHYQIEQRCEVCHGQAFSDKESIQTACVRCHSSALKEAEDSHPKSKFTNPRNADRVAILDARYCVTCHVEHKPELTHTAGVTLPPDFCRLCHGKIAKDRPSHQDFTFDNCAASGCHNYHDNRALYEEFLVKHRGEAATNTTASLPQRNFALYYQKTHAATPIVALTEKQANAPLEKQNQKIMSDWLASQHARAAVNCNSCHALNGKWQDTVPVDICQRCHKSEVTTFNESLHGMRNAQHLPPMTPEQARLPMKGTAKNAQLTCQSCHGAHRYDVVKANSDACQNCHNDKHSLAFRDSPHFKARQQNNRPLLTCSSCHMPRIISNEDGFELVRVVHNQSANLRPNSKMIRDVCLRCHGLEFTLDALADRTLVENNFTGKPSRHLSSVDLAWDREEQKRMGLIKDQ